MSKIFVSSIPIHVQKINQFDFICIIQTLVTVIRHNRMYKLKFNICSNSANNQIDTSNSISTNNADEAMVSMSNITEYEGMLQSVLTIKVDLERNDLADTSDKGIEVLEITTHHSTSEEIHDTVDVVSQNNEFESALNESKRFIQVLCLRC